MTKGAITRGREIGGFSHRAAAWLAWSLLAVCVVLIALGLALDYITDQSLIPFRPGERDAFIVTVLIGVLSLAYPAVGVLIASRLPTNPIGWIFCSIGLIFAAQRFATAYADYALLETFALPLGEVAAWFSTWVDFANPTLTVFLMLLFPVGRLPSRRWRIVAGAALLGAALSALGLAFMPDALITHGYVQNPFGIAAAIYGNLTTYALFGWSRILGVTLLVGSGLAALCSVILRLRHAGGNEREQLKWFLFAVVPLTVFSHVVIGIHTIVRYYTTDFLFDPKFILTSETFQPVRYALVVALLLLPIFTYVAILRYNLYDIDVVINRTLVYGALTACVVAIYVLLVVALGALFQARGNLAISLLATGLVAVAFQPLRGRLQRSVNRLMYGERDDPYAVVSRLGKRLEATLEPEAVLPTVVETIAQALKLPYAAILLKEGEGYRTAASYGSPKGGEPETLPLVYQREKIGRLVLSPRAPGETFSDAERGLLEDLARQAEVAVHAVRLTADLQHSRERLVATREEERRRLRRDLHDGLGAQLAGLNVQAGTIRRLIPSDPGAADELVVELRDELRVAISDIRRLVYDLRPPALDDLGLVEAMRQLAEHYDSKDGPLRVVVKAPEDLPNLSAAVEVAVYRITQEALTNVARHARATTCFVRLAVNDSVTLEIADDGVGIPAGRSAGVGLSSMHERAEELGGACTIEISPGGGTRVLARLPLAKE